MSKGWKIAIGVIVAVVIVAAVVLVVGGRVILGQRIGHWRGWEPRVHVEEQLALVPQLEVRLVDDDGDGVPDRGVLEFPAVRAFGAVRDRHFDRVFGRVRGRPFGTGFGLLSIGGGLLHLALLALLVGLIVFVVRCRSAKQPPAPADTGEEG